MINNIYDLLICRLMFLNLRTISQFFLGGGLQIIFLNYIDSKKFMFNYNSYIVSKIMTDFKIIIYNKLYLYFT